MNLHGNLVKVATFKKLHTEWFHLYKYNGCLWLGVWEGLVIKWQHKQISWSSGTALYLDCGERDMSLCICQSSLELITKIVNFRCKLDKYIRRHIDKKETWFLRQWSSLLFFIHNILNANSIVLENINW